MSRRHMSRTLWAVAWPGAILAVTGVALAQSGGIPSYKDWQVNGQTVFTESNVGIGTTTPGGMLEVKAATNRRFVFTSDESTGILKVLNDDGTSRFLKINPGGDFGADGPAGLRLYGSEINDRGSGLWLISGNDFVTLGGVRGNAFGNYGECTLRLYGSEVYDRGGGLHLSSGGGLPITADQCINGSFCSDRALKTNIVPLAVDTSYLDRVMHLQPVTFRWKEQPDGPRRIGLIAQDVEEVLPEVVTIPDDEAGLRGLSPTGLEAVLVQAIKELKAENDALVRRVQTLEELALRQQVDELEPRDQAVEEDEKTQASAPTSGS
ncbi:MAG: tail fiber domain-containing protein [Planctomycetota bacterium]